MDAVEEFERCCFFLIKPKPYWTWLPVAYRMVIENRKEFEYDLWVINLHEDSISIEIKLWMPKGGRCKLRPFNEYLIDRKWYWNRLQLLQKLVLKSVLHWHLTTVMMHTCNVFPLKMVKNSEVNEFNFHFLQFLLRLSACNNILWRKAALKIFVFHLAFIKTRSSVQQPPHLFYSFYRQTDVGLKS